MKKNNNGRRNKHSGAKNSQHKTPPTPSILPVRSPDTTSAKNLRRVVRIIWGWRNWASWMLNALLIGFDVVCGVQGVWGPPWPVPPEFAPGPPSYGSPLDVPFSVANKSGFAPVKNIRVVCLIKSMTTSTGAQFSDDGVESGGGTSSLSPGEETSYTCPFNQLIRTGGIITSATIQFSSEYDNWLWPGRAHKLSSVFTLDVATIPPQWETGVPLQ